LVIVKLIHKSDVYFEVFEPTIREQPMNNDEITQMHHGEIYIYKNQIYLFDGVQWYLANVNDIKEIKSNSTHKQIFIHFLNFDIVLFCNEYTHLVALRDFLYLSQNEPIGENFMLSDKKNLEGTE